MKKAVSIFLFSLYFFGSTDAYQLLKAPQFVEHYKYHRHINPELSFSDFLQIHYNGKLVVDDDFDKDMQLPFKTTQVEFSQTMNIIVPPVTNCVQTFPVFETTRYLAFNQVIPHFLNNAAIFQPPRVI